MLDWRHQLLRFLVGFISTVLAILISSLNKYSGAILTIFPSVILTSLVSLWFSQSETVAIGATSPIMFGSISTAIFALIFAQTFSFLEKNFVFELGNYMALLVAIFSNWFLCVTFYSFPAAFFLRKKELDSITELPRILLSEHDTHYLDHDDDEQSTPQHSSD
eukprot:TRINITY_DN1301_c0_g1_i12.p1 TRINITY_DN1301_c0_g1~~TRINITY_DN1301_c0_g1_i12.p1  ORF type:complete len:163 (-),score=26.71 TRINITY_DN1301_c0_g1_i12:210-698(-)